MESSHLVIFLTSGKFMTKFKVLRCISLSETLFWTGARGRIPITLKLGFGVVLDFQLKNFKDSTIFFTGKSFSLGVVDFC